MRKIIFSIFLLTPLLSYSQLREYQIPFVLNSDTDPLINIVDTDDDNDGVLDNLDFSPLNGATSGPTILSTFVTTSADAGLRNNSGSSANTNYGTESAPQTKNFERSMIMKFDQPANLDLVSATLTLNTGTENDPLQVYVVASNWLENTVTYNSFLTNFNAKVLLGTTAIPVAGVYTFNIPLNIFSLSGGPFTILVYDANDPTGATESLLARETSGKAAKVEFKHREPVAPRVMIDQSAGTSFYLSGGNKTVGYKLTQAPTSTVYLPIELSDTTVAKLVGDHVLVFSTTNWNVTQNITIMPIKVGTFDIHARPLHSNDGFYNGHNPNDATSYHIQATNISNLTSYTLATGDSLHVQLNAISALGASKFTYKVIMGPVGLNVVEKSGFLTFRPLSNQIGVWPVTIEVTDDKGNVSTFKSTITVTNGNVADPIGKFVVPSAPNNPIADGSPQNPYNNIATAVTAAAASGGGIVYVRGGVYNIPQMITISTNAPAGNPVVIKPLNGEHVKFDFAIRNAFVFDSFAKNIILEGFEIDGGTDGVDFWCIVAQAFWGDTSIARGGGLAIVLDGEKLGVKNNYIHDCYQKAVEIPGGRYVEVHDNIIHSIANTSLSGGHGIMRQQKGREFFMDDDTTFHRWDILRNVIFNVEQRIFSWVPQKGFIDMVLDEGKPILIDDPKDSNNVQELMKARIKNNIVAYGSIDQIRLKSTPNLEVSNNSVYSAAPFADGITDKVGDDATPTFENFKIKNNAVHIQAPRFSYELQDAVNQAGASFVCTNNYHVLGCSISPSGQSGITAITAPPLFTNANEGEFKLNPTLGLPSTIGVEPTILNQMDARMNKYGVKMKWDQWPNDLLVLTQTILDNIPGVNDGVTGNETVFTNFGTYVSPYHDIDFTVVNGSWKTTTGSPGHQKFELNEPYYSWYIATNTAYKNATGGDYERIRWGDSHLKQNQLFDNDWLTVSQITSDSTNTVIRGETNTFTLDGDILIDFQNYTPSNGETFDLIIADEITTLSSPNLFDRVLFEGYTPSYTLAIVTLPDGLKAVRLTVLGACSLNVTSMANSGPNTLRDAIACAVNGNVITLDPSLVNDTIKLTGSPLIINKNITINSGQKMTYVQNCTNMPLEVGAGSTVLFNNFHVLSDVFTNKGNLECIDMVFKRKNSIGTMNFVNSPTAHFLIDNETRIE